MDRPTGLRLLGPGWFADTDAGARRSPALTGWLSRLGADPLLVEEARGGGEFGRLRVSAQTEPSLRSSAESDVVAMAGARIAAR